MGKAEHIEEKEYNICSKFSTSTVKYDSGVIEMQGSNKAATRKKISPQDCSYDVTYPAIYTKKYMKNANQRNSKHGRLYDKLHACPFCKRLMSNVQSHMQQRHRKEKEVKDILDIKRKIDEANESHRKSLELTKKSMQKLLRNKGDNLHNRKVLALKEGEILLSRRKHGHAFNVQYYGPCPECEEWVILDHLKRHQTSNCPRVTKSSGTCMPRGSVVIQSQIMKGRIIGGSKQLQKEVFPFMMADDKTEVAQEDRLITTLGDVWLMKNINNDNKVQRRYLSSFRMRLSAGLLLLVRKETGIAAGSMSDFLRLEHFDTLVQCSLKACQENEHADLKSPSTALKLGYDLNRLASAKLGFAIKENHECDKNEARDFLKMLQMEWDAKVSKLAKVTLDKRHITKKNELLDPEDIRKVTQYLVQQLKSLDRGNINENVFREAIVLTQARLILYNRCRLEELEGMSIEGYLARSTREGGAGASLRQSLTMLEEVLVKSRNLVELPDKTGLCVPLLIPNEVKTTLEVLADGKCRQKAGIKENNKYMFANTGQTMVRAGKSLEDVKRRPEVGLIHPERISGNNLQKQTATIVQALSLDDDEVKWICDHLGHTDRLDGHDYCKPAKIIDRIDIAKLMLIKERDLEHKFGNRKVSDIQFDELHVAVVNTTEVHPENQLDNEDMECGDIAEDEDDGTDDRLTSRKSPRKVHRVKWTNHEEREIRRYFVKYFNGEIKKKCPSQKDCRKAVESSRKEGGIIYLRKWETLKKKVSNMLITIAGRERLETRPQDDVCRNIIDAESTEDTLACRKGNPVKRVTWTKFEEWEIRRYFKKYFNGEIKKTCPNLDDCTEAIENSSRDGGRIHLRKWDTLKKKVANMLIANNECTVSQCSVGTLVDFD